MSTPGTADQAQAAAPAATDFTSCQKMGGKCTTNPDGSTSCSMNGKTFTKPKPEKAKASLAFKKITIASDGTRAGTEIMLDGKPIAHLGYASFTFYNDDYGNNVLMSFSQVDAEVTPGAFRESHYYTLVPPASDSAEASMVKQPATPVVAMPRGQGNIYTQIR